MDVTLMKEYAFKIIDKYVFIKRVYFDYANERVYMDLLVYTKEYQSDMDYLLDYIEPAKFNKVAEQTIKSFLEKKGIYEY